MAGGSASVVMLRLRPRERTLPMPRPFLPTSVSASPAVSRCSPAVGYFTPVPQLAVGQSVQAGDLLGSIDVLGVVQEVNAPSGGIVARVLAEEGQAVEYGQALAEIDPLEVDLEAGASGEGDR